MLFANSKGFSLVELLVTLAIGAFIMFGMSSVLTSSRSMYTDERESAFVQENARYAVERLTNDIRLAGSAGCGNLDRSQVFNIVNSPSDADLNSIMSHEPIAGYEGSTARTSFPSAYQSDADVNSDSIILRYGNPATAISYKRHSYTNNTYFELFSGVTNPYNVDDTALVASADCAHVGIFQVTASTATQIQYAQSNGTTKVGNCDSHLVDKNAIIADKLFNCQRVLDGVFIRSVNFPSLGSMGKGGEIVEFVSNAYYIGDSNVMPGVPALKRRVLSTNGSRVEELAQGVESLELFYGLDPNGDGEIDQMVDASTVTDWSEVKSVRFEMTFRSLVPVFDEDDPNTPLVDERYLRYQTKSTVAIRNR